MYCYHKYVNTPFRFFEQYTNRTKTYIHNIYIETIIIAIFHLRKSQIFQIL